jgi:hypothetical protein
MDVMDVGGVRDVRRGRQGREGRQGRDVSGRWRVNYEKVGCMRALTRERS